MSKRSRRKAAPQSAGQEARTQERQKAIRKLIGMARAGLVARYDAMRPDYTRPRPEIRTDFTETEQVFSNLGGRTRALMYAEGDQLFDNAPVGAQVDTVVRMSIGDGGEPVFTGDHAENEQRVWADWAAGCGYFQGECWRDVLGQILRATLVHGDCLVLCDRELTGGKIAVYDADQICNISEFQQWLREHDYDPACRQAEGALLSPDGRCLGWFLTAERNRWCVSPDRATFIPASLGRLVFIRRKITQYRGESALVPNFELSGDTNDLLKAEIRSAQLNAEHAIILEEPDGVTAATLSGVLEGFDEAEKGDLLSEAGISDAADLLSSAAGGEEVFRDFEGKSAIAKVSAGTKVTSLNNAQRPSTQIREWTDHLADMTGQRLGVMSCLSRGRADNTYSSGQIEVQISWLSFAEYQRMLETQVIRYVLATIMPGSEYIVNWPKPFEIDPEKTEKVLDMRLRAGRTTYRELLGPRWKEKLQQLADEKQTLENLDLTNLSFWQTNNGGLIQEMTPEVPSDGADIDGEKYGKEGDDDTQA